MLDTLTLETAGWALDDAMRAKDMHTASMLSAFHSSDPAESLQAIQNRWKRKDQEQGALRGWKDLAQHMLGAKGVDMVKQLHDNLEGARLTQELRDRKNGR